MKRISYRDRTATKGLRVSVEGQQDAYDPVVRLSIRDDTGLIKYVELPPELASAFANDIKRAVEYALEGR